MVTSLEIRLKSRPVGMLSAENFELATVTVPDPAPGEVQVKNIWMTVDPYMRGRMKGKLTWKETVEHGIENAPTAFLKLFKGENLGKMLVKLV